MSTTLAALHIGDPPTRWEALGFTVRDGVCELGGICVRLGVEGEGITAWALTGLSAGVDGLANVAAPNPGGSMTHPNGATGIDHVVVVTPDFDRTSAALDAAGIALRRTTERGGRRMGFRRLGPAILELVQAPAPADGPAHFWGLVVSVADLDAVAQRLGEHLGAVKPAVQPGRRIATLRPSAGLGQAVAFMDENRG